MAGRPSKLDDELLEKARAYLPACMDNIEMTDKGALAFVEVNLPTIVGLALHLGINKDTVYSWSNKDSEYFNEEFSDIVKDVLAEQEKRLINNGLGGLYTSKALGMLMSKHGYAEKTETDVTTKGESINNSEEIKNLTTQLNDLHRSTSIGSNGGTSSALGTQTQD